MTAQRLTATLHNVKLPRAEWDRQWLPLFSRDTIKYLKSISFNMYLSVVLQKTGGYGRGRELIECGDYDIGGLVRLFSPLELDDHPDLERAARLKAVKQDALRYPSCVMLNEYGVPVGNSLTKRNPKLVRGIGLDGDLGITTSLISLFPKPYGILYPSVSFGLPGSVGWRLLIKLLKPISYVRGRMLCAAIRALYGGGETMVNQGQFLPLQYLPGVDMTRHVMVCAGEPFDADAFLDRFSGDELAALVDAPKARPARIVKRPRLYVAKPRTPLARLVAEPGALLALARQAGMTGIRQDGDGIVGWYRRSDLNEGARLKAQMRLNPSDGLPWLNGFMAYGRVSLSWPGAEGVRREQAGITGSGGRRCSGHMAAGWTGLALVKERLISVRDHAPFAATYREFSRDLVRRGAVRFTDRYGTPQLSYSGITMNVASMAQTYYGLRKWFAVKHALYGNYRSVLAADWMCEVCEVGAEAFEHCRDLLQALGVIVHWQGVQHAGTGPQTWNRRLAKGRAKPLAIEPNSPLTKSALADSLWS